MEFLSCTNNQLTNLDLSNNRNIRLLNCSNNNLNSLDIKPIGGNTNYLMTGFSAIDNPNLYCIQVNHVFEYTFHFSDQIDSQSYFAYDCSVKYN